MAGPQRGAPGTVAGAIPAGADGVEALAEQLREAQQRLGELAHELTLVRSDGHAGREHTEQLRQQLDTIDGRTQRHETGQEIALRLQQELSALSVRFEEEAALSRDQRADAEREQSRERADRLAAGQAVEAVTGRLDTIEGALASERDRGAHLTGVVAERDQGQQSLEVRIAETERRIGALHDAAHREEEERARLGTQLPDLAAAIDRLAQRSEALAREQRRVEEELAATRAVRDRERELLELLEQQRTMRTHVEERLMAIESEAADQHTALHTAGEQRALIQQRAGAAEGRLGDLQRALDGQRDAFISHVRRTAEAAGLAGRRDVEELELQARINRELLVRLIEESGEATQEQPL